MCVTKDDILDCVDVELQVLQVCDTEDNKEYVVSIYLYSILYLLFILLFIICPSVQHRPDRHVFSSVKHKM